MDLFHDIISAMGEKDISNLDIICRNDGVLTMAFEFSDMVMEYGRSDQLFDILLEVDSFDFKQKNEDVMIMTLYI